MEDNKSRKKISSLRQKICQLRKTQEIYIKKLFRPRPMIVGSLYEVYKTCSKANCCCSKGNKHGPFFALSISSAVILFTPFNQQWLNTTIIVNHPVIH